MTGRVILVLLLISLFTGVVNAAENTDRTGVVYSYTDTLTSFKPAVSIGWAGESVTNNPVVSGNSDDGLVLLSGKMERCLTREEYDGSSHHFVTVNGYTGMPLYTLISTVDDLEKGIPGEYSQGHFSLNTDLISENPYMIIITNYAGGTYEISSSEIAGGKADADKYVIAAEMKDGTPVKNGPVTLVGTAVSGEFGSIKSIELTGNAFQGEEWYLFLEGKNFGIYLGKSEVEALITSAKTSFTDPATKDVWSGIPLETLLGYVDDYSIPAFSLDLAETGYTITLISGDGYQKETESKLVADDSDGYIVANKLNDQPLTGNNYPLRLVGESVYNTRNNTFTNLSISGLTKIRLTDFQEIPEELIITVVRYDENGGIVKQINLSWAEIISDPVTYPVIGDGKTDFGFQGLAAKITEPKLGQGVGWDLKEEYLTGNWKVSNKVKGVAVSTLTDLVGGMNTNDQIVLIADDNWKNTFEYNNIYETSPRLGTAFIAWYADGKMIPAYKEGPRLFFTSNDNVFSSADMYYTITEDLWHYNSGFASPGGLSAQNIVKIEIRPKNVDWTLQLNGFVNAEMTKGYFESGLACISLMGDESIHSITYTDSEGNVWGGMPLWLLTGFVDDENSHSGESYNRSRAQSGYNITITGRDGSTTVSSKDAYMNAGYLIANTKNGVLLTEEEGWPLRLAGSAVTGEMEISGITEISLDLEKTAVPQTLDYTSRVTVSASKIPVIASSGSSYDIAGNTVLGAILASGLKPVVGDKKYSISDVLLFDGLVNFENSDYAEWRITVNSDTVIDGYGSDTKSVAVNIYEVKSGDVITGQLIGNDGTNVEMEFSITIT